MNRFKRFAATFLQSSIAWGSLAALGFFARSKVASWKTAFSATTSFAATSPATGSSTSYNDLFIALVQIT